MNIYISHKSRKEECIKFKKYWEEEWFPQIKRLLYDFCKEINGEIVNADLAEKITEDYAISECQFAPISGTLYKENLVTINKAGVFWHNHIWDNIRISSLSELIQFFDDNGHRESYVLEDQEGKIYSLSELTVEIAKYE